MQQSWIAYICRHFQLFQTMAYPKLLTMFFLLLAFLHVKGQDTIVFENKHIYLVEVMEESETQVIYKKYPSLTNSAYVIQKRFITDIRYKDPKAGKLKFRPDTLMDDNKLEVWVSRGGDAKEINGLLHRMDDSTLILKKKSVLFDGGGRDAPEVVYIFPYAQINHISARKQNRIVQGAFIGAAGGFVFGTLVGLGIFKDSEPCDPVLPSGCDDSLKPPRSQWEKALTLGFGTAGAGAIGGGIIGGIKIKIPIGGQKDLFNAAVPRLHRLDRALKDK